MAKTKKETQEKNESALKPDPETLHTTDPQEDMEGPVSTFMQNIREEGEKNNEESKEEADRKKEENI